MTKRYILLTAIICTLFSQKSFMAEQEPVTRHQKESYLYTHSTISAADITGGTSFTAAGGFYKLGGRLTSDGNPSGSINITANGTVIDLNGGAITKNGAAGGVAINIDNNVKDVIIRNGSIHGAFDTAIKLGNGVQTVTIQDVVITGCVHANGAINMVGNDANNPIVDVTLDNVKIIGGTTSGAACHINGAYVHGLTLTNVFSRRGANTGSGQFTGIKLNTCTDISGTKIASTNHVGVAATVGVECIGCNTATINLLNVSNNNGATGANTTGLKFSGSCNKMEFNGLLIANLLNAAYGIDLGEATNITLNEVTISGCTNGTSAPFTAVRLDTAKGIHIKNSSIVSNTATTSFIGITTESACYNITVENVEISSNTASAGSCYGMNLIDGLTVNILNSTISQNTCSSTADSVFHVRGIYAEGPVASLLISGCNVSGNSRISTATNATSTVAGIWIDGVNGCSIYNTNSTNNTGSAQAFGFYVTTVNGLLMESCVAKGNAAGTTGSGHTGGIAQLPSAGLYLLSSNAAVVSDCKFIYNRAGNKNEGNGTTIMSGDATSAISVATCCGGFGVANVGTSTSVLNVGNAFTNCVFKRNGTQISNDTLTANGNLTPSIVAPQYNGSSGDRRCWESEAIEAGAIEQNTDGTSYTGCVFEANGLSQFVTSYGLCISNGDASVVQSPQLNSCKFIRNGFYGVFDNNSGTTVINATSCMSSNNGNTNTVAVAVTPSETTRNWNIQGGTSIYTTFGNTDKSTAGAYTDALNINATSTAAA